jgi:glycosyltransferase involved in cell wall biosynthesis
LRILHIAYIYPPRLEVGDGITNVVYNVTKGLAKRGHEVVVYTSDRLDLHGKHSLSVNQHVINGVNVHYLRSTWRYKTFITTPSIIPLLSKDIRNFDIIHVHDCRSFQGISAYLLASAKNIPYVYQPHGSHISPLPDSNTEKIARIALDKLISRRLVRNASRIIALSQIEAEQYRNIGIPDENIAIIPNGIDLSKYGNLPPRGSFKKKLSIDDGEQIILYLGRIHKTKGIDFLIKAYAHLLKKRKHNTRLVLSGPDDGYLRNAKDLISSLGISNKVLFPGFLTEREKLSAYVDSSLVVAPEQFNVFLLVPLEAAACGKPVIVSSANFISNTICDGGFGFSVKYGDIKELAEIIGKLLSNDVMSKQMGQKGRTFIFGNCDWDNVTTQLEKVYNEVVN